MIGVYLASYKSNAPIYMPVSWGANTIQESTGIRLFWPVFIELLAASAIIVAVLSIRPLQWLLNVKPIEWLGKWSFSLYLTHTLVLSVVAPIVFKASLASQGYVGAATLAIIATVCLSLLVAEPFRRVFDLPSIRVANRIGKGEVSAPTTNTPRNAEAA